MNIEQVLDQLWDLSFTAGMNQRYHQSLADGAIWLDTWTKITVAIVAIASACVSIASWFRNRSQGLSMTSAIISIVGLCVAVALNIAPTDADVKRHLDLFRQWSDLRQETDSLIVRAAAMDTEDKAADKYLVQFVTDLIAKKNRINAQEPVADRDLLTKCYDEEVESRTGLAPPEHKVESEKVADFRSSSSG